MQKKNVLHIISSLEIGGAEKLLITLIKELEGHCNQYLIILSNNNPLISEIIKNCSITIIPFEANWKLLSVVSKVKMFIKKNSIEIVHTQLYWPGIISRLATSKDQKVINTLQAVTSESTYKPNKLSYYLEKLTYKPRHIIIAVSQCVLDDFDKWIGIKGKSFVFYNIIDDNFFMPRSLNYFNNQSIKLIAVGNLRSQKNYGYLVEAFKKLPPNISLDIYGEGTLRNKFQEEIDKYNLQIKLCGHSNSINKLLSDYDFFVMSSLFEGFSLALMEAMAIGLVPLLSNIDVLKEAGGNAALYFDLTNTESFMEVVSEIQSTSFNKNHKVELAKQRALEMCNKKIYINRLLDIYNN